MLAVLNFLRKWRKVADFVVILSTEGYLAFLCKFVKPQGKYAWLHNWVEKQLTGMAAAAASSGGGALGDSAKLNLIS